MAASSRTPADHTARHSQANGPSIHLRRRAAVPGPCVGDSAPVYVTEAGPAPATVVGVLSVVEQKTAPPASFAPATIMAATPTCRLAGWMDTPQCAPATSIRHGQIGLLRSAACAEQRARLA